MGLEFVTRCSNAVKTDLKISSTARKAGLLICQLLLLTACVSPGGTPEIPMPCEFVAGGSDTAETLLIFLPGRGDDMQTFKREGFIELLRQSDRPMDAVLANAHLGYYYNGVLADRVYQDILVPYRQKGYRRFFIVGTSLGGYGALWINHEHADLIAGLVLIAPYLGKNQVIREIENKGGTSAWRSELDREPGMDDKVWLWIDEMSARETREIGKAILAFGQKDKFSRAAGLLTRSIPESHVFVDDGGHNWTTWRKLWAAVVASDAWRRLGDDEEATRTGEK